MRSFTPGYYPHLSYLLRRLNLPTSPQYYTFSFPTGLKFTSNLRSIRTTFSRSTITRLGGLRPFLVELFFTFLAYLYFTFLLLALRFPLLSPFIPTPYHDESLATYTARIRLPSAFTQSYLLPLIAAMASADPSTVASLPAIDVVKYRLTTLGTGHVTVSGGIGQLQTALLNSITRLGNGKLRTGRRVESVESYPTTAGKTALRVRWRRVSEWGTAPPNSDVEKESFDIVIFAVPPNVVARLWTPAKRLEAVPVWPVIVEVVDWERREAERRGRSSKSQHGNHKSRLEGVEPEDTISLELNGSATHWAGDAVAVITRPDRGADTPPMSPGGYRTAGIVATRRFLRVGRTPESRKLVNEVLGMDRATVKGGWGLGRMFPTVKGPGSWWGKRFEEVEGGEGEGVWRQGGEGVYITGGWCWDGMVLLEGCVVSAERVVEEMVARRGVGRVASEGKVRVKA